MRIKLLTRTMLTLSIAVMAILGKAHAGTSLPKEIVGMWCYYSMGENGDARNYLRNDASAPKPDTPCRRESSTTSRTIARDLAADGRYELFKTSTKYDGKVGREQHHYPPTEKLPA